MAQLRDQLERPDATETDRLFYQDVWSPQELQHGILLDAVQQGFGMTPAATDLKVSAPIRRQEPGHFAFYRMSAEVLVGEEGLSDWQLYLARILRRRTFEPVGVNNRRQRADFGDVAHALDFDRDLVTVARQVSLVERELLWAQQQGMKVPGHVLAALQEAITLGAARKAGLAS